MFLRQKERWTFTYTCMVNVLLKTSKHIDNPIERLKFSVSVFYLDQRWILTYKVGYMIHLSIINIIKIMSITYYIGFKIYARSLNLNTLEMLNQWLINLSDLEKIIVLFNFYTGSIIKIVVTICMWILFKNNMSSQSILKYVNKPNGMNLTAWDIQYIWHWIYKQRPFLSLKPKKWDWEISQSIFNWQLFQKCRRQI